MPMVGVKDSVAGGGGAPGGRLRGEGTSLVLAHGGYQHPVVRTRSGLCCANPGAFTSLLLTVQSAVTQ